MSLPGGAPASIDIPKAWRRLALESFRGLVMVVGGSNTGKSTLVRYLYQELVENGSKVCILDGDPGQSWLGPPACMTLAERPEDRTLHGRGGPPWRRFIGAVTPQGHMLPMLTGAARLIQSARRASYETILFDTSGFIDPERGGYALKLAEYDLLQPEWILMIQARHELAGLADIWRKARSPGLITLETAPALRPRPVEVRQAHRREQFRRYFRKAEQIRLNWQNFAIRPAPRFSLHRLIGFENQAGDLLGMGIISDIERKTGDLQLLSSLGDLQEVCWLNLGDVYVDPGSFTDRSG